MLLDTSKEEILAVVSILREKEEPDENSTMRLILYGFYTNKFGNTGSGSGNSNFLKICMPKWASGGDAGKIYETWRKENIEH